MTESEVTLAEELVFDAEQISTLDDEVAAAGEPHRVTSGGPVERLGHRRSPVDDNRLAVLVGDGETPDVERLELVG